MKTEPNMTIVTALIRPHMEGHVVQALHDLPEFPGFFVAEVRGQGRGRGEGGTYRATEFDFTYHRFLELKIICRAAIADQICGAIGSAAWTGRKGDGIIFTAGTESLVRIREIRPPGREHRHD